MGKLYIEVLARFKTDGTIIPIQMKAGYNGEWLKIDKVTDSRRRASLRAGGVGMRYTCVVPYEGVTKTVYLLYDEGIGWFIEVDDSEIIYNGETS